MNSNSKPRKPNLKASRVQMRKGRLRENGSSVPKFPVKVTRVEDAIARSKKR